MEYEGRYIATGSFELIRVPLERGDCIEVIPFGFVDLKDGRRYAMTYRDQLKFNLRVGLSIKYK